MKIIQYADVMCDCGNHNVEPKAPENEIFICGKCHKELEVDKDTAVVFSEE
jgi:Zn finger protein HypA/HybF involved in hydrogenase expression